MNFGHRIWIVYVKELIDILRDRRTLIAMIVVPIVLYPLLMLGSIQAVSTQTREFKDEKILLAVQDEVARRQVFQWLRDDEQVIAELQRQARARGSDEWDEVAAEDPALFEVVIPDDVGLEGRFDLDEGVRLRRIRLGVEIEVRHVEDPLQRQYVVSSKYDPEEVRSASAYRRFRAVLDRRAEWTRGDRLGHLGIPVVVIEPIVVQPTEVTTPGSMLGQILPLILVLMTITGAIYPAIDLTAGERERGTLETLMVCPVPVLDLVVGKFLVVTTVAIMGAALNLASVSATVYFGGFESVVGAPGDAAFPWGALPLILVSLIPFAILMSALMIAVCSFARTFKEAQNYITPVILAVLIPGGIAALPTSRLEGVMTVMPVANMVLLTKELLLGGELGASVVVLVLFSTSLYALAAIAVATRVFGTESVVFADTASLRSTFSRRLMRPAGRPTLSMAVLVVALLFPIWFYVQSGLQSAGDFAVVLRRTGQVMPIVFILVPLGVCAYFKVNIVGAFALGGPQGRYLAAAALLGLTAWVPAHALSVAQQSIVPMPAVLEASEEIMQTALANTRPWLALLLLALVPAVCEEFLFRGFLLGGLATVLRKWPAIICAGCVFGAFHFYVFKFPVTAILGVVLGYLCWQSRSIWPAVVMHALHNGITVSLNVWPGLSDVLGIGGVDPAAFLPLHLLVPACLLFVAGLLLVRRAGSWSPEDQLVVT
ncbi:MAG TPA: ABC transporter permease subunit/CPBP intramembrane protease [Phycisphaerae bacterium]|nr:ABC transporter permease subunit/CPBP intramembrane protease [Phycisphaerae bacterium]